MECHDCGNYRGMQGWAKSQQVHIRVGRGPNCGGRDVCRICWRRGPGERDLDELQNALMSWQFDKEDLGRSMSDFLMGFIRSVGIDREAWSHHGMLPSLLPSDPRDRTDAGGRWTFDPTNRVYRRVVRELCPLLATQLGWQCEPTDETCGDCIEALLGMRANCPWGERTQDWRPAGVNIRLRTAARYSRLMSYRTYSIFRILGWFEETFGDHQFSDDEIAIFDRAIQFAGPHNTRPRAAISLLTIAG
jgi:hypothetical protein